MLDPLSESLWFYTAADYLIINAFLWKNRQALEECIGIVWSNNRGVIAEAEAETPEKRFASTGLDARGLFRRYVERTPEKLDRASRARIMERAIVDIRIICRAAAPAAEETTLYRNVPARFAIGFPGAGETVELPGLTSTSTTGQEIDYGKGDLRRPDQVIEIELPAGLPAVSFENEENEVILPPMAYAAMERSAPGGADRIRLRALRPLDLEELIRSSRAAFPDIFGSGA